MEIDFLILQHKRICPVEVKSSRYKTHSSLDKFREKFKGKIGQAYVTCARTRPKFISGERAHYVDELK